MTEGGSQLLSKEYISAFGLHGEGKEIKNVLDSNYIPLNSASTATKKSLSTCKYNKEAHQMEERKDFVHHFRDHAKSWRTRKETTCSYHQHMGHYTSVFKDKQIGWSFFQMVDIPDMTRYPLKRHRECIYLMIAKNAMCYDVRNSVH